MLGLMQPQGVFAEHEIGDRSGPGLRHGVPELAGRTQGPALPSSSISPGASTGPAFAANFLARPCR